MRCAPEKVVAYIDLLGFSEAVKSDLPGAVRLLQDYADAITVAVNDAVADTDNTLTDPESSRLMGLMTVDSFETMLPMSDSVFIVASDMSKFVMQLSHFLLECFRFRLDASAYPARQQNPMAVTTKTAVFAGSHLRLETQSETWWPLLFRGGIAVGECLSLDLPMISDNKLGKCRSLAGKAVVKAVSLEKQAKGPRILCSQELQLSSEDKAAAYIGPALNLEADCFELYWPLAALEDTCSMTDAINNRLRKWLKGIANFYRHFRTNDTVRPHYEAYLHLVVASALRKYPDGRSEIWQIVRDLGRDLLEIAFPD